MSQTKFKIPAHVRMTVQGYICGYGERVQWYEKKRSLILCGLTAKGEEWEEGAERAGKVLLQQLEEHPETMRMRAVECAQERIGEDIANEQIRRKLCEAVWRNALNGRGCPYEALDVPAVCRAEFYERRRKFFYDVAVYAGLMGE